MPIKIISIHGTSPLWMEIDSLCICDVDLKIKNYVQKLEDKLECDRLQRIESKTIELFNILSKL